MLERQVDCDWTSLELASWPEKPQPSSGSIPLSGRGRGREQSGPAPHLSLSKASAVYTAPCPVFLTCLKVGSGCQPVPGQTSLPL